MKVGSRKPVEYSNLKVFRVLAFVNIKQDKVDDRIMNCVFIDNIEGMKAYKVQNMDHGGEKNFLIINDTLMKHVEGRNAKTWK